MFLWPPFHNLRMLDEQDRKNVHDRVREILTDVHLRLSQVGPSREQLDNEPKAKRSLLQEFNEWKDAAEAQTTDKELDSYLRDNDSCKNIRRLLE
ncbi:hypothetical protein HPB48_008495 [Haemaphysalis longicornis]|uniref:Uncharacterized protein n=1 Tax=Haemaphysalis longicornis TaxID=44386 RepID=A0A9J6GT38_HAELO|nr:hypothetical protein HPB48_008495 [Haemaphysalis longicornis]